MVCSELVKSHQPMCVPECVICVAYCRSVYDDDDDDTITLAFLNILLYRILSHPLLPFLFKRKPRQQK